MKSINLINYIDFRFAQTVYNQYITDKIYNLNIISKFCEYNLFIYKYTKFANKVYIYKML